MILLPQQFQALVYHLISGWVFALLWSGMNRLTWHFRKSWLRWIIETIFYFCFVTAMYFGLVTINGGLTQLYLIVLFCVGVWIYLQFYAMTFSPFFEKWVKCIKNFVMTINGYWKKQKELKQKKNEEKLKKNKKQS